MGVSDWSKHRSRSRRPARRRWNPTAAWGSEWLLEERCLLAASPSPVPFPNAPNTKVEVLSDNVTGSYQKTITIKNNSQTQTIYAFIEGANSRKTTNTEYLGTAAFDPYDPADHEYRGYIGYADGANQYAGLPPQSSITFTVPIVFWDGGRIIFSTDGANQFNTYNAASQTGAPFFYLDQNTQAKYFASIDPNDGSKLNFTPINNSFVGGKPSTQAWTSPVAAGVFQDGQVLTVTAPSGATLTATVSAANPGYLTISPAQPTDSAQFGGYVFQAKSTPTISPTLRNIEGGFAMTGPSGTTTNGLVMWYHASISQNPGNDAPFQLSELSYRGTYYSTAVTPGFQYLIDATAFPGAQLDSADYDLSFVDTINMPIALEATNVTVPYANVPQPFGWVGSAQTIEDFQQALVSFTSTNQGGVSTNYLGSYFGGKGFPSYVNVQNGNIKLPAGQNIFLASPVLGATADIGYYQSFADGSSIKAPLYALTTGTPGPTTLNFGGISGSQGNYLALNLPDDAHQYALNNLILADVAAGKTYNVTYNAGPPIVGHVVGPYTKDGKVIGVQLDVAVPSDAAGQVWIFSQPQYDYAASTIAGLWYSWAKYYAEKVNAPAPPPAAGTVIGNVVTLNQKTPGLVPGMAVTGTGVAPGTVILSVGSDQRTVRLSAVPTGNPTSFTFASPAVSSIAGYDPSPTGNTPTVKLSFSTKADQAQALAFAQTVYVVMSSWGPSVSNVTSNQWVYLLANIIGGNLGSNYLPNANLDVVNTLTVLSKSALRGVPDFTDPLYSNQALWYPDPALPAGGQTFNAYNLDPLVWFIHQKLGLTAYAFSLDDDIGNVQGGGANNIAIGVGGIKDLPSGDPYTNASPWGVVTTMANAAQNASVLTNLGKPKVVGQITPFDYNKNLAGTLINGPGLPRGAYVQSILIPPDFTNSSITINTPLSNAQTGSTYSFFGALVYAGTVLAPGQDPKTIILKTPDAYETLKKVGPLQNLQVTGAGIPPTATYYVTHMVPNAQPVK
ncbi:MAG: hypothetical protein U0790_05405 [Isosphaeraceae bacterium]